MARLSRLRRPAYALPVIAAVALLARLVGLGARVAHQDEARVAHWILHYMAVDAWQYRPIIHGPFLPHVNGVVFSVLGPSDFTARLVVAVVGGLLPLAAWLFRSRLSDAEVIALGALYAANPVLVYYSRFMRNEVLLGAFAVATVGLLVRAIDTGRARYLLLAGPTYGLAVTTKENALLYPIAWLGALLLVTDYRLFGAAYRGEDWLARIAADARRVLGGLWRWRGPIVVALLELAVVVIAFYAPKPDLYRALAHPTRLPEVLEAATLGTARKFLDTWASTSMHAHSTVAFFAHLLKVVILGGAATAGFSVIGYLVDRYGGDDRRPVVAFGFYWGTASILGYAIVSDIQAAWTAVHVLVALAIPAAAGLAFVYERGRAALARDDRRVATVAVALLVLGAAVPIGTTVATSYVAPQSPDNPLVQYAQPSGDMKPTLRRIERISREHEGVDVLFYGEEYAAPDDRRRDLTLEIGRGGYEGWFARLPLPWYLEIYGANVSSTTTALGADPPPVVITLEKNADEIETSLATYDRVTHQGYLWGRPIVFFVDTAPDSSPTPLSVPASKSNQ